MTQEQKEKLIAIQQRILSAASGLQELLDLAQEDPDPLDVTDDDTFLSVSLDVQEAHEMIDNLD
jgi:hypothetical protein